MYGQPTSQQPQTNAQQASANQSNIQQQQTSGADGEMSGYGSSASTARDQQNGDAIQAQQLQSQQAMQDISQQFQSLALAAQQLSEGMQQFAQMYPMTQEILGSATEGVEQIKQAILGAMIQATQAMQAPPQSPPQV